MKRVLCLIESLGSGGAERQLSGLAVMLKQQGYDVEVWYFIRQEFYLPFLQENGVSTCCISEASNPSKRFFVIRNQIQRWGPDVVISYTASVSMITCALKLFGAKWRLIVSERSTTQKLNSNIKLRFFLYRWADVIVPNSHSQKQFVDIHFPRLSGKVKVITNFVDTEKFKPQEKCRSTRSETKMVCVGRMDAAKNLLRFIEAVNCVFHKGYNLHVDWFGQDLEDDFSRKVHDKISMLELENTFVLHTPSSTIQEEYCKADVFCLPSLYEGFPNVLCEAMSCGKPVLCSRVCDNPSIVRENVNGFLFNPLSVTDMAITIEKYLGLAQEEKDSMCRKSREMALELFSKDSFIEKYLNVI